MQLPPDGNALADLVLSPEVVAARVPLLSQGVVVIGDGEAVEVTGAGEERVLNAAAEALPGRHIEWLGETPRELRPRRSLGWRDVGGNTLKISVPFRGDEHLDEIVSVEDDSQVVVLAIVCTPRFGSGGREFFERYRVYLDAPLAGRVVVDGCSGQPLEVG